ncbi:TSUP family transporter [Halomonas sp. LS-001]
MGAVETLVLLCWVAVAIYAQTITGFAFGLLMMGGVVLTGLIPISLVAILISILSFFNAVMALYRKMGNIDREIVLLCSLSAAVTLVVGVWVLDVLSGDYVHWLQLILGVAILLSSLTLILRPLPSRYRASRASFLFFGSLSGLMGGMFASSGPPLVFHFYRQPLGLKVIRDSLLLIFAINGLQRLVLVGLQGKLNMQIFWLAAMSMPVVIVFTWLGRRYPPRLSGSNLRRVAFVLLFLSGASLCISALLAAL